MHLFLIGILMRLHQIIPKILSYLALFTVISYSMISILKWSNGSSVLVTKLEMVLALPMALGELRLAIWLLMKGGREKHQNNVRNSFKN
ncbi:DUF4386 family protein [Lacinutrix sp. MEBiC02404]